MKQSIRFWGKISKINEPLIRLIRKEREKTQSTNTRNKIGTVTTDPTDIKSTIRKLYEQLYSQKPHKLDEINKLIEKHRLPQLTQHEIDHLNSLIQFVNIEFLTEFKIEFLIEKLPTPHPPTTCKE